MGDEVCWFDDDLSILVFVFKYLLLTMDMYILKVETLWVFCNYKFLFYACLEFVGCSKGLEQMVFKTMFNDSFFLSCGCSRMLFAVMLRKLTRQLVSILRKWASSRFTSLCSSRFL
ncbi:hypothetical protein AAZX31_09G261500 [Glycine max]